MNSFFDRSVNKVLITGSSGFTGRYVWAECEKHGYLPIAPLKGFDITSMQSCRETLAYAQPHFIIHLAALSFIGLAQPNAFYDVNTVGTLNLVQATQELGLSPELIIVASSGNVYGNIDKKLQPIAETVQPFPTNHYGASKLAMELLLHSWFDKLPIIITRPFNYSGVGQSSNFLIPKLVKYFAHRKPNISLGNIQIERDYTDVRDIASTYVALLDKRPASLTLNLCSGSSYSLEAILKILSVMCKHNLEVNIDSALIRRNEIQSIQGSSSELFRVIGHRKLRPLIETLEWMVEQEQKRDFESD